MDLSFHKKKIKKSPKNSSFPFNCILVMRWPQLMFASGCNVILLLLVMPRNLDLFLRARPFELQE